ncbi:MAG: acyl-CoA dehydrogenase [Sulfobacillus thermosulfidooxidans]|uniref:Acyl-CoA dehydrogenase n=1 Tax=Sulfobacillus thermotolerans TaxID=338644 RepID=A0ABM6RR54_9FIRM|nr:acyl-CoA dehydrogenase family protein [Sulfobacillus sp. hq2]AUW93785.1 acyl-CoA dehydrogenase [Sulfobacillus thermotolerans]MCY0909565.1 acyl-CoA dehydrogenase family protein [Sulfobacillus thermotolerans]POB11533.1 acyl-CoA dehydrogenase [Sulfobacillus sp. hq2]PSR37458.1 MAG: acyl-CoA dehydrogenase [Sulfobacillus thermosulfidooxidans]
MDFELTPDQRELQEWAHTFAEKEIRPVAALYDEKEEMPWDVLKKAAKVGLLAYTIPEAYGGNGVPDLVSSLVVGEELFWGCAGIATAIGGIGLASIPILEMGSEEQKRKWLPLFCDPDQVRMGAMCLTEPEAGSDVVNMSTKAVKQGHEYILNGTKTFITNGGIADVYVVFAKTNPEGGYAGVSAFIVDGKTPGISSGKKFKKLGLRASHTAEVHFDNVHVPEENLLGQENMAFLGAMKMLEHSRPTVAIAAVGVARAAYEYALAYTKERVQFGKPIYHNQAVSFTLSDMLTKIEAGRLLAYRAAWLADQGRSCNLEGSMAKAYCGDMAMEVATNAVQLLGGYGYIRDYPVEKWLRDAKIMSIYEGTTQIQKRVMTRLM